MIDTLIGQSLVIALMLSFLPHLDFSLMNQLVRCFVCKS
jgi:hypothetical protein